MIEIETEDRVMTAKLKGELDHHSCALMRKTIDMQTESHRPKILRLDFSSVQFMDSSGIGLVMGRYRQMLLLGGTVEVVNVPDHLRKIFKLSGLYSLGVLK